jgi:hypothetical protein
MERAESQDEMLYEFLERRPVAKILFATVITNVCLLGFLGNFIILFKTVVRRNPFDLLTANVALGMIILTGRFFVYLIEETTHDVMNDFLCSTLTTAIDVGTPLVKFSLIAMILLIKVKPNTGRKLELGIVIFSWIFATISAIPLYNMQVLRIRFDGKEHNICASPSDPFNSFVWTFRYMTIQTMTNTLPVLFLVVFFTTLAVKKAVHVKKFKHIWIYATLISTYFLIFSSIIEANVMAFFFFNQTHMNITFVYIVVLLLWLVVALNPILFFIAEKRFMSERMETVKYRRNSQRNQILINERDDDDDDNSE